MCGIGGYVSSEGCPGDLAQRRLNAINHLIAHRGPDGKGCWNSESRNVGLTHTRLSVIDLSHAADQPMVSKNVGVIVFNGEIYNYLELRKALAGGWEFRSRSDTECILAGYARYGKDIVNHLRGMFAFAIWDEHDGSVFCARDRFGIKPFYYTVVDEVFYFASEAKALIPFLKNISTDSKALSEYLTFQFTIGDQTLFEGIKQLMPGHALRVKYGRVEVWRYWDIHYDVDFDHSSAFFERRLEELVEDSMRLHLRSDVPVGAYVSGGIDSSLIAIKAAEADKSNHLAFHGRFTDYPGYDESDYAAEVTRKTGGKLHVADISAADFRNHIQNVIYHLDFPVAGPGSFPQFMVSKLASQHLKVVLGGQGGDEIFGGYARYLVAYFEQCIKAAIDGTYKNGNFVVTIESIVPNLGLLREYKPMIKEFWRDGLFESVDRRYFRLVDRSSDMRSEVDWDGLDKEHVFEEFQAIFNNTLNVKKEAYFDKMTHFDFKTLLPALLHVEDRMSMASGLESRVPLLDHPLVEFAATIPADVKFKNGQLKHLLKSVFRETLPNRIVDRRDKMGFPVPLKEWFDKELKDDVTGIFEGMRDAHRPYINAEEVLKNFGKAGRFSRKAWGLMSLELWHQSFHDKAREYKAMVE